MATSILKFRPVLTHPQIDYLTRMIREDDSEVPEHELMNQSILRVFVPLLAKIDVGAITPSYSISPESEQKRIESDLRKRYENDEMSPEEQADYESKILGFS